MGIETIVFVFAIIVIAAVWGSVRRARRAGGPDQIDQPSNDTVPRKNVKRTRATRREEP